MAIKGILFDNQAPTAKGIRGGFHSALTDGILEGCSVSYSGKSVVIGPGLMHIAGGIFSVTSNEYISVGNATSGYARVKAVMDLSRASTIDSFDQIRFEVDTASSPNLFPALTQGTVNTTGSTIYQAEICVVSLGASGITGLIRRAVASAKIQYGDTLPSDAPEGTIFLLKTN